MKTLKLNLALLACIFIAALSSCQKDDEMPTPQIEDEVLEQVDQPGGAGPKRIVVPGIPISEYQSVFESTTSKGYMPVFIDGFLHTEGNSTQTSTKTYVNIIFEENVDKIPFVAFHGLTGNQYQEKLNQLTSKGFRLSFIESYPQNGKIRYAPIFCKTSGPAYKAMHGVKASNWQDKFDQTIAQGFRLVNRSIVKLDGKAYVTALFDKKNVGSWVAKSGLDENETQTMMENNHDAARMLNFLDISQSSSTKFTFGPIFSKEEHNGWYALNLLTEDELNDEINKARDNGYDTNVIVAYDIPGLINGNEVYHIRYAASWVKK